MASLGGTVVDDGVKSNSLDFFPPPSFVALEFCKKWYLLSPSVVQKCRGRTGQILKISIEIGDFKKCFPLFLKDLFSHADFKKRKNIFSSFHAQANVVSTCVPKPVLSILTQGETHIRYWEGSPECHIPPCPRFPDFWVMKVLLWLVFLAFILLYLVGEGEEHTWIWICKGWTRKSAFIVKRRDL